MKSLTLDKWQTKWIETVSRVGNRVGNSYYENRLPVTFRRPVHSDGVGPVEHFIRAKYERKEFVALNEPPPSDRSSRKLSVTPEPVTAESTLVEEVSPKTNANKMDLIPPAQHKPQPYESFDLLGGFSPIKQSSMVVTKDGIAPLLEGFSPVKQSAITVSTDRIAPFILPPKETPFDGATLINSPEIMVLSTSQTETRQIGGLGEIDPFSIFANKS